MALGQLYVLSRTATFALLSQDVQLAKSHWLKVALGRVALSYAHDVGNFMDIEVTVGAELDPGRTRYVFEQNGGVRRAFAVAGADPALAGVTVL